MDGGDRVEKQMTQGKPYKIILLFALPLMLGNLFNQLYYTVDSVIVGRFVGTNALSAVGSTDWLNYLFMSIIMLFPQGFGILIAKTYGKKDKENLNKVIQNSLFLSLIILIVVLILSESLTKPFLLLLNTPEDIIDLAEIYIRIIFAGIPLNMIYHMTSSILRSFGDSKSPLIAMIVAAVLNVVLDLLFIITFKLGIAGAAIATVIAQGFSALVTTFFVFRHRLFTFKGFSLDKAIIKELMLLALPVALQGIIISLGGLAIQGKVNTYGTLFVAGFTAGNKIYGLLEVCATSYGLAITTFVSQNYGAKRFDRIKKGTNSGAVLSVLTSLVISLIIIFAGKYIVMLFLDKNTTDYNYVLEVGTSYLKVMAYFLFSLYLLYNYRSAIQGLSNTIIPMTSGVLELIVRVVCAYTIPLAIGSSGLFYSEVLAWFGAAIFLIISFYLLYRRKLLNNLGVISR